MRVREKTNEIRNHVANPINTVALMKCSEWTLYLHDHFGIRASDGEVEDYFYEIMVQAIERNWRAFSPEARQAVCRQALPSELAIIESNKETFSR
jgi:hypothetical protein